MGPFIDHKILLTKLDKYSIRGLASSWFESYLKDRSLIAKVTTGPNKTVKSDRFNIMSGTAQGSCLSPLLFIIFINDIHLLPLYSKIILFADDTTIFNSHQSSKYLQYMMEYDLQIMLDRFKANKLSLNLCKTMAMKFWTNKDKFELKIDNYVIPLIASTKFLGVHIDNQLTWYVHANHLIEKLNTNR